MIRFLSGPAALLLVLASCASVTPASAPTIARVALDADFPDPAVLRAEDGPYYAYATQASVEGRMVNIQIARSPDLRDWRHLGDALPVKPAWASQAQDFWAPHVAEVEGRYLLYYSAKPDAALADPEQGLCLAVATADRPEGPFTDIGKPLLCGPGFVNIDPMLFDDPQTGKRLLYWGSGFGPIKVQEMRPTASPSPRAPRPSTSSRLCRPRIPPTTAVWSKAHGSPFAGAGTTCFSRATIAAGRTRIMR